MQLSYFICATPRTGSTLLCDMLTSSGVAGHPESYFRAEDRLRWADRLGVHPADENTFVAAAIRAGSTSNGVFGARVMWGTEIIDRLDDPTLFGARRRFVRLRRLNVVAQAVSWLKAEQSGYWQFGDAVDGATQFDRGRVDELVRRIAEHDRGWTQWFDDRGVRPYEVTYEDLDRGAVQTATAVLDFLGLHPVTPVVTDVERQANRVNAEWIDLYTNGGNGG